MDTEEIIKIVLDESIYIHKSIGPGMLENVYHSCLAYRLKKRGLFVETEKPIPLIFEEIKMECGYRADLIIEKTVIIEVKSVEAIIPLHLAQTLTYLRCLNLRFGLLLNFNTVLFKNGIKRVVNGY